MAEKGFRFVLTASRVEMSSFGNSWMQAMRASFPQKLAGPFVRKYLKPSALQDGSAREAPYGLRKIEAILKNAFGDKNVVVSHPDNLDLFVGPSTEAVMISSMDPLGLAYVSSTYNPMIGFGGKAVTRVEFERVLKLPVIRKYRPKIIVGGFGVWQIRDSGLQEKLGVDILIAGECEDELVSIINAMETGTLKHNYIRTTKLKDFGKVPLIEGAATFGSVEITRGCGRRCQFCSPDFRTKYDFPLDHIINEVETNIRYGLDSAYLVTEDIFLYGNDSKMNPSREKLGKLLKAITVKEEIREIAASHASLVSVIIDNKLLEEITPVIIDKSHYSLNGKKFIGVDVGIESGSVRMMKRYMSGKSYPLPIERWPEIVVEGTGIFNDNDWYPMYTFVMGLPGESPEDVVANLELLDNLKNSKIFLVPLMFVPLEEAILRNERRRGFESLTDLHWEFILRCWNYNLKLWAKNISPIVKSSALALYPYLRHVHGHNVARSMLRFIGFPVKGPLEFVSWKRCETDYCSGSDKQEIEPIIIRK